MNKFELCSIDNKNITLKLGEVKMDGSLLKVKVKELKKESNILFEDEIATVAFTGQDKVVLSFKCEPRNKLLDITNNQDIIDYIYKNIAPEIRRSTDLYYYSSTYKDNYEE